MTDINCRLYFVACEDPKLDTCPFNVIDGLSNIILKLVLNGCRAYQIEVDFELFGHFIYCCFFIGRCCSFLILSIPFSVVIFFNLLGGNQKSSQSFLCISIKEALSFLYIFVILLKSLLNDGVGSLCNH